MVFTCLQDVVFGQGVEPTNAAAQVAAGAESQQHLTQERVEQLIEQLGNPSYRQRVNAQWELQRLGQAAFEDLRIAATSHENIQIASSARYIIDSQDIVWWLETDSARVRGYLKDYGAISKVDRAARIMALAVDGSTDAWLALCRLARYERHDNLSKAAALALMEALTQDAKVTPALAKSLNIAVGDGYRPAVQWIRLLLKGLTKPSKSDLDSWNSLVDAERKREHSGDRDGSRAELLRLYTWLGGWLTATSGREDALDAVRPSLQLVENRADSVRNYAVWALDNGIPELVQDLAEMHTPLFDGSGLLTYLLAESYLHRGEDAKAQQTAQSAFSIADYPSEQLAQLSNKLNIPQPDRMAANCVRQAIGLSQRGLFEWAEREYRRALDANSTRFDRQVRESFSEFYWLGGEHSKAVEILMPLASKAEQEQGKPPVKPRSPFDGMDEFLLLSTYYLYDGLAKIDSNDFESARSSLAKAYDYSMRIREFGINPDIIIAMKQVALSDEDRQSYERRFNTVRDDFRRFVVENEKELASAPDRRARRQAKQPLAVACNQLAWLLGKCETHTREAVMLSRRSLDLRPDYPIYLDTLARCQFANGDIATAVQTQQKAVSLSPHERQMKSQLAEFEQVLKRLDAEPTPDGKTGNL